MISRVCLRHVTFVALAMAAGMTVGANTSQAAFIANATFGYNPLGTTTTTGGSLGTGTTSVTIPALNEANSVPATYLGMANDFASAPNLVSLGDHVTVGALTLNVSNVNGAAQSSVIANYIQWEGRYSFDMSSIQWNSSGPGELDFTALGTFHDTTHFSDSAADVRGVFLQGAAGGAIVATFTFETPPNPNTNPDPQGAPEPGTFGILIGLGTIFGGIALRRRR